MHLTWLGHATVVLDVGGTRLLTDPLLRRHAFPLRRHGPVPPPSAWSGTDAVLLSHLHHDHAELASLRLLPDVPVLAAASSARWLRGKGLHGVAAEDGVEVADGVHVRLVRADHSSRPMPHRPNDATGHLVTSAAGTVWLAGDTALHPDLEELPAMAGGQVDVAVVPLGGWGPRLSEGHMGPEEAAQACARVGARAALGVHWGTLHAPGGHVLPRGWSERPGPAFAEALARTAPGCRLLAPPLGGGVEV